MDKCWGYFHRSCVVAMVTLGTLYYFYDRNQYPGHISINFSAKGNDLPAPRQHIYYLKTHKTGSTTMYSILAEFCRAHELSPLLPSDLHINQHPPFHSSQILTYPDVTTYDMVFSHHIYSDEIITYLHKDTFKFTTLRDPLRQFISSFVYFRNNNFTYLSNIVSSDPLKTFLENPKVYETKGYHSYTNNRQSMDLGYNLSHNFDDLNYINSFVAQTENRFDLVLITDYFDQSLILIKRKLHWTTSDIIYFKKLESKESHDALNSITALQKLQHKNISIADTVLYEHFLAKFKQLISEESGLEDEVIEFQSVLSKIRKFCGRVNNLDAVKIIPAGRWTDKVVLEFSKCKWLTLDEILFTKYLKSLHSIQQLDRRKEINSS